MAFFKKHKKIIITTFILLLIVLIILLCLPKKSNGFLIGSNPSLNETEETDVYEAEKIENIKIPDYSIFEMGLMDNGKYYTIMHGVFLQDESYRGELVNEASDWVRISSPEKDLYKYIPTTATLIEKGTKYYAFNSSDEMLHDNILLVEDPYGETIGGYWVLCSDYLKKTYPPLLIKGTVTGGSIYADDEKLNEKIDLTQEEMSEFISTFERVSTQSINFGENNYGAILINDGSGLSYGNQLIYDSINDQLFIASPSYSSVLYMADDEYIENILIGKQSLLERSTSENVE